MPIYEFYCQDCHMIFNFLSRRVNTRKRPACPRCHRPRLERKVSPFAISKGRPEPAGEEGMPEMDESRMEQALEALGREAEGLDEDDPRQAGQLMRKLCHATGLPLGEGMEEAIRRMEAGEDPERIEEEMGDLLEEDPLLGLAGVRGLKGLGKRLRPPEVDETLHEL